MFRSTLLFIVLTTVSCSVDQLPPPSSNNDFCSTMTITYDEHIDSLLTRTCSYASCHDGNSGLQPILSYGIYRNLEEILLLKEWFSQRICLRPMRLQRYLLSRLTRLNVGKNKVI